MVAGDEDDRTIGQENFFSSRHLHPQAGTHLAKKIVISLKLFTLRTLLSALRSSLLPGIDIRKLGPTWRRLRFSDWNILLLHTFYYLLLTSSSGS